jgi:hypothetical protein
MEYTRVPTTCYCMTNMTVVGTFLSRHKRLTQFQYTNVAKQGGGGGARGLFGVHPPTAKVGEVCKLAPELKFARLNIL